MSNVETHNTYSVVRDPQGRWILAVCDSADGLPTGDIPDGALAYDISSRLFLAYDAATVSWGSISVTLGQTTVSTLTSAGALSGLINGLSTADNIVRTVRKQFTVAQVNAAGGTALVAGIAGQQIQPIYAAMIAIGGAVTQATTIDIIVQTSGTKPFQGLQANLTENAVADDLASGLAPLAAGLSFTPQTAGKGVLISKTGADEATATHVDVIFVYTLIAS